MYVCMYICKHDSYRVIKIWWTTHAIPGVSAPPPDNIDDDDDDDDGDNDDDDDDDDDG